MFPIDDAVTKRRIVAVGDSPGGSNLVAGRRFFVVRCILVAAGTCDRSAGSTVFVVAELRAPDVGAGTLFSGRLAGHGALGLTVTFIGLVSVQVVEHAYESTSRFPAFPLLFLFFVARAGDPVLGEIPPPRRSGTKGGLARDAGGVVFRFAGPSEEWGHAGARACVSGLRTNLVVDGDTIVVAVEESC